MTNAFADAARLRDRLKTWAVEAAYPIWWEVGADRVKGGFFEKIDLDGQAVDGPRRGRVLPRQIDLHGSLALYFMGKLAPGLSRARRSRQRLAGEARGDQPVSGALHRRSPRLG